MGFEDGSDPGLYHVQNPGSDPFSWWVRGIIVGSYFWVIVGPHTYWAPIQLVCPPLSTHDPVSLDRGLYLYLTLDRWELQWIGENFKSQGYAPLRMTGPIVEQRWMSAVISRQRWANLYGLFQDTLLNGISIVYVNPRSQNQCVR